jgi:hypothetical protein
MADYSFKPEERQILSSQGKIEGLKTLSQRGLPADVVEGYLSGWLGFWLKDQLAEAEREVRHLQSAVTRLQQLSMAIDQSKRIKLNDPRVGQFMSELRTFDGWMVSLTETVFSIYGFLDPKHARSKLSELNTAMSALLQKRETDQSPFEKDSSLFKSYLG